MNIIQNKKIAIVGAGPGGLTLARLLQMNGVDVKVYERDVSKDARMQGATLDLHEESGLLAIREAGLMEEFKANYRPGAENLCIMDQHANIVFREQAREEENISRPEIDRGPLQQILLNSLRPGTVEWGRQFETLEGDGTLTFKNGASALADIVIAADGANSTIRPYITPIKAFYSGIMLVEGAVHHSETASPKVHGLLNGGKIFAMGDEKTLIVSAKGDGSLVFYTSWKAAEGWSRECGIDFSDKAQVLAWFKVEYAGWDSVWQELFENADVAFVPRPQYCMPLDQGWEALPSLTMLGDAAHLMPPFAGEGVNMAMLDAVELSRCLTGGHFTAIQPAIAAYEKQMRKRAAESAKDSLESTAALHSSDAIPFLMRLAN
jgi:2-polyprenyl-6-methoxyphenol hydroxylase-like FAD-dependent oxidoreductase